MLSLLTLLGFYLHLPPFLIIFSSYRFQMKQISTLKIHCVATWNKTDNSTSWAKFYPKMDLSFEIQKSNVGIRISILLIPCVSIFWQNRQISFFRPKFAQQWILGSEFQKSKSRFQISSSTISYEPIFSLNGQLWIFGAIFWF